MKKDMILEPRTKYNYKSNPKTFYDVIIIGTGIVGFSTAMYASRLGLKTLIIGEMIGGTIALTDSVENWPGIVSISGMNLAKLVENHAKDYPINISQEIVKKVEKIKIKTQRYFKVKTKENDFSGKTVVFCTGTKVRELNVPGEKEFKGRGVSYCALCDGPLFRDKVVGVVGGSDSAVKEALLLSRYAKKVYIIYRKQKLRAEPINLKKLEEKIKQKKIEIISNTNVKEIHGDKLIKSVIFDKPYKKNKEFPIQGLFIGIGHISLSELTKNLEIKLNKKSEIIINKNSETNIKGVYAAGDVTNTKFKQAITGSAEGVTAAYQAYEYVNKGEFVLPCGECE